MIRYFKRIQLLFFFPLVTLSSGLIQESDTHIHGYVFDESTGDPIEDVNVYIANSTWGSSTNKEGYYSIRQIPPGTHELVVTNIGYDYETTRFLLKSGSEKKFNFQLKPIIYETETTIVESTIPNEWLEDLEFFKYYFLGATDFIDDCEIKNKEVLEFNKSYDSTFEASAPQPLVIQNNALGYKLQCILINFLFDKSSDTYAWSIKPKFIDLESGEADQIAEWHQNRFAAYEGSVYHFLRSFKSRRLPEEGFDITKVSQAGQKISRGEWRTVLVDYKEYLEEGHNPQETILHFEKFLHVVFDNSLVSWIRLNYTEITLDEFGYPVEESPYMVYGEWAKQGVANLLPKNYLPKELR
jgi:hypothetical protein